MTFSPARFCRETDFERQFSWRCRDTNGTHWFYDVGKNPSINSNSNFVWDRLTEAKVLEKKSPVSQDSAEVQSFALMVSKLLLA